MATLEDDFDGLDRLVSEGATKDIIRHEIREIAHRITTRQADYARLAEAHANLKESKSKSDETAAAAVKENAELVAEKNKLIFENGIMRALLEKHGILPKETPNP
jgi:hypothetical protein